MEKPLRRFVSRAAKPRAGLLECNRSVVWQRPFLVVADSNSIPIILGGGASLLSFTGMMCPLLMVSVV
jgi:hypothetical protein